MILELEYSGTIVVCWETSLLRVLVVLRFTYVFIKWEMKVLLKQFNLDAIYLSEMIKQPAFLWAC